MGYGVTGRFHTQCSPWEKRLSLTVALFGFRPELSSPCLPVERAAESFGLMLVYLILAREVARAVVVEWIRQLYQRFGD